MYAVCYVTQKKGHLDITPISDGIDDVKEAINLCNVYRKIESHCDKFYVVDESGCFLDYMDELDVERENIVE